MAHCQQKSRPRGARGGDAARGEQSGEQIERWRQTGVENEPFVDVPGERNAHEQPVWIAAHVPHQAHRFAICPNQDVQAVIEHHLLMLDATRAPAQRFRCFEYGDLCAVFGKRDRGRHPGVATADHRHFHKRAGKTGPFRQTIGAFPFPPRPRSHHEPLLRQTDLCWLHRATGSGGSERHRTIRFTNRISLIECDRVRGFGKGPLEGPNHSHSRPAH